MKIISPNCKIMKKHTIFTVSFLLISFLVFAQDRRTDKSVLTIATLNCEFLWDGVMPEEGSVDFPYKNSQTEAEEHMSKVAEIIKLKSPDIINLVEVENIDALTTFNNKFLSGLGYLPRLVNGKDNATGQDVCMLTRVDPEQFKRTDNRATVDGVNSGVSKNYFATFTINNLKIAFIGLHLVAFPNNPERSKQRNAQASVVASLGDSLIQAGYQLIVLGDFNDYDGDNEFADHQNNQPVSHVLQNIRGMNITTADDDLINLSKFDLQNTRYTAFWDKNENGVVDYPGEFSSIDHILISNQLAGKVQYVEIPHTHNPLEVTDHFMVFAMLKLESAPPPVSRIRMVRAMPNPEGNENTEEYIVLKNFGTSSVNIKDWYFTNPSGKKWIIGNVSINANQEIKIKRSELPMALRNNGDIIELKNKDNIQVHSFSYTYTQEGEEIFIE